ncbi:phosphocarrier protein [Planomicrobium soli]|uniref:Phosphocarrier protein n=1 Tax=Planomicrobium soli TaxID=1176648 RepID=A0A2P8GQL9_9BACL|nr:HPr family phosphocarrier protein [Planomicrobium soli]PSL36276.1 phosphocarrier protein [Planomicrobium soli]
MVEKTYKVISDTGIQARSAAQLVNLASQLEPEISLKYRTTTVNLKSIMGLMSLAIGKGAEVVITAKGNEEQEALQKIDDFIRKEIAE